jgi:hypothetical protein
LSEELSRRLTQVAAVAAPRWLNHSQTKPINNRVSEKKKETKNRGRSNWTHYNESWEEMIAGQE